VNRFTVIVYPLAGFILIVTGCSWIYRPLGPLVAGILLLMAASLGKKTR